MPADPTAGQFPADAARIRLAIDALAQPMQLLPRVAGISLDLLDLTVAR